MSDKVLVTGSSGFVGRGLLAHLGSRAVGVSLRGPWAESLAGLGQGFSVVHLAGLAHQRGAPEEYFRVNVECTLALAQWAEKNRAKRLIFLSSAKALGEESSPGRPLRPQDPPKPVDAYGISKRQAEDRLHAFSRDTRLQVVTVRAPLIYGPGVKGNIRLLMRLLDWGVPLPLEAWSQNQRSFVGLSNLVSLIEVCLVHPQAAGRVFHATDREDVSTAELIQRLALAMGRRARHLPVSPWLLETVCKLAGKTDLYRKLSGSLCLDSRETEPILGWKPTVAMAEELIRTAKNFSARERRA